MFARQLNMVHGQPIVIYNLFNEPIAVKVEIMYSYIYDYDETYYCTDFNGDYYCAQAKAAFYHCTQDYLEPYYRTFYAKNPYPADYMIFPDTGAVFYLE
jgi:hypothetical protein